MSKDKFKIDGTNLGHESSSKWGQMIWCKASYFFGCIQSIQSNTLPFITSFIEEIGPSSVCNKCVKGRMEIGVQFVFCYLVLGTIFGLVNDFAHVVVSSNANHSKIPRSRPISDYIIINIPINVIIYEKKKY